VSLKGQKYRELEALLDLDGEVFPMESGHGITNIKGKM
jgi:hypothetical protein